MKEIKPRHDELSNIISNRPFSFEKKSQKSDANLISGENFTVYLINNLNNRCWTLNRVSEMRVVLRKI